MSIVLATTGYPNRELSKLLMALPQLSEIYEAIILSIPDNLALGQVRTLELLPNVLVIINEDWQLGRHSAIQKALSTSAAFIHYADLDRLLHWVETDPVEWQRTVSKIKNSDCLIIGRTEKAFETHPRAVQQTEKIINTVFSRLLNQRVDLGGGSRGFSRKAAEFIIRNSHVRCSWSTDSEWTMLLHRSGYHVDYIAVNGLDSPGYTANYDMDANHWAFRVKMALEIIQEGIAVDQRNGSPS